MDLELCIAHVNSQLSCSSFAKSDNFVGNPDIIHMKTEGGNTALHAACVHDRVEVAALLANNGIHIDEANNKGKTSLEMALEAGALTCYRKLK